MNYLNIGSNWASAARAGRDRANRDNMQALREAQVEQKRILKEKENELLAEQQIKLTDQTAEALTKFYRPGDLKAIQDTEKEATQALKARLEAYGDDVGAFMRGGGMAHLKEYRDTIVNSERAKIVRANVPEIKNFLKAKDESPHLLSNADVANWNAWSNGSVDKFTFRGNYLPYVEPENLGEYTSQGLSIGHAYLNAELTDAQKEAGEMDNFFRALHNYNIDTNQDLAPSEVTEEELINHINMQMSKKPVTTSQAEELSNYLGNSKKTSDQILNIFNLLDRGYQGNFLNYWTTAQHQTARDNMTNRLDAGSFDKRGDNNIYSTNILRGQEKDILSKILGIPKDDADKISSDELYRLIAEGNLTLYDYEGNSLANGEDLNIGPEGNLKLEGISLAFEVATDRDNNKYKLLSYDDVLADEGLKNNAKDGVMVVAFRDEDRFGKDEYVYVKLDIGANGGNNRVANIINEVTGEMDFRAKKTAEKLSEMPQYEFVQGEKFNFTPENSVKAISSLHNAVENSAKRVGITEYNDEAYAMLMAHALHHSESYTEGQSPQFFIDQITKTSDPTAKQAMQFLAQEDTDYLSYINTFKEAGELSQGEALTLMRQYQMILNGYKFLKDYEEQQNKAQ